MTRKQFNIRLPQPYIDIIKAMVRDDIAESESHAIMRLIDWYTGKPENQPPEEPKWTKN